jgi:hypothetical protein
LIVFGILAYIAYDKLWKGGSKGIDDRMTCNSLTYNDGVCKESCDRDLELDIGKSSCEKASKAEGVELTCCSPIDEDMQDTILPTGYGGSKEYRFDVTSISIDPLPSRCTKEENSDNIVCPVGNSVSFQVKIGVTSTGSGSITAYANPVIVSKSDVVDKDNLATTGATTLNTNQAKGEATSDSITIDTADAIAGNYYKIYPYGLCNTQDCKDTDAQSRGVYRGNQDIYVMVKFTK